MNIKNKIKNDLWRWNYIVPFVKKYSHDAKKTELLKQMLKAFIQIKPVKAAGHIRTIGRDTKALLESVNIELTEKSRFVYFIDTGKTIAVAGNIVSNFPLDYSKVVKGAFFDLAEKAFGADFYGSEAEFVASGVENLANRILNSVKKSNHKDKERLVHDFSRMLRVPVEHFDEALQRILFFNQIMWQTRHRLNGLGRLDYMLDSLYVSDIADGYMTKAEAVETVKDFLDRLSCYPEYKSDALKGDIGQIIILGGLNPDGSYFVSDLTEIFLTAQATLKKPDPKTLLRVSREMPETLMETAVKCLLSKTGSPLFSNDDVVIPALIDFGIKEKDAYNYCVSACWEPFIVGKSFDQNNMMGFDFFTALDTVLNESDESVSGFDELVDRYIAKNRSNFKKLLDELDQMKWAKDPFVSIFTEGCSEKRKDIADGGAIYNDYGVTTVALSNVVDSLLNIKKIVFEQKKYSLLELNQIRMSDFKDQRELFVQISREKYYGRDREDSIALSMKITDSLVDIVRNYKNSFGGTVKFGLSSPGYNMMCKGMSADLSGRKKNMPYNTHISCLHAAYTEVVNFAARLDYKNQRFNGNVVDFFASPSMINNNIDKFVSFMKGAVSAGFFQMQMNLLDSRTLIEAKAHPDQYSGLIVRVWGFSAYFSDLPESYQDLLIERAQAAERAA